MRRLSSLFAVYVRRNDPRNNRYLTSFCISKARNVKTPLPQPSDELDWNKGVSLNQKPQVTFVQWLS